MLYILTDGAAKDADLIIVILLPEETMSGQCSDCGHQQYLFAGTIF